MKTILLKAVSCVALVAFILQAQAQTWTKKDSLPSIGKSGVAAFSIGHYGFVGTGQNGLNYYSNFWRWNQDSNTWTAISSYPGVAAFGTIAFTINGVGYVGMGGDPSPSSGFWAYDTGTNTWTHKANFPGTARYSSFVFVIGTNAYIGCGSPGSPPYLQDVWKYNSLTDTWTQKGNFPIEESGMVGFAIGKNGYAGAGAGSTGTFYDTFYQYDTASDTWTAIAPLPYAGTGLTFSSAFVIGAKGYVGGGRNSSSIYTREFWAYDTTTRAWSSIANFAAISRGASGSFAIGNFGYIVGGTDSLGNNDKDFWQYGASTAGVEDVRSSFNCSLYPNPNKGSFTIVLEGATGKSVVEVFNIMGQEVYTGALESGNNAVELNTRASGIYLYRVIAQDGSLAGEGKLIIQK